MTLNKEEIKQLLSLIQKAKDDELETMKKKVQEELKKREQNK